LVLDVGVNDLGVVFVDVQAFGIEVHEFDNFLLLLALEPVEGIRAVILVQFHTNQGVFIGVKSASKAG
jgi:hypothetical protein